MGHSKVITPFANIGLKLLGLAIPLTIMVLLTVMMVQAYNKMTDADFGGNLEAVSSPPRDETGGPPQTAMRGR